MGKRLWLRLDVLFFFVWLCGKTRRRRREIIDMTDSMSTSRIPRKARAMLRNLLDQRLITPEGLNWLTCATDPFHDTEVRCTGYPDVTTAKSICQVVTKTMSVKRPAGIADTDSWGLQTFFVPLTPCFSQAPLAKGKNVTRQNSKSDVKEVKTTDKPPGPHMSFAKKAKREHETLLNSVANTGYVRTTVEPDGTLSQAPSLDLYAGWNVINLPDNDDWQSATLGTSFDDLSLPPEYCTGAWRLVATGLEVTNTTAQLYKGGSVTVYRSPSAQTHTMTGAVAGNGYAIRSVGLLPPSNMADASLYPNSKTWGAEDGCYLIGTINDPDNPYFTPVPGVAGVMTPTNFTDLSIGSGWLGYFPDAGDPPGTIEWSTACAGPLPYDTTGAVLNGLNNQSTIQVTARYFIERHPTVADPNLLVLAQTPAPYDPVALEIYSRAMNELPVGCKVGDNPMGEWFNDVISAVADWAPKIGKALGSVGIPLAQPIGTMVGAFAKGRLTERTTEKPDGTVTTTVTKSIPEKKRKTKAQKLGFKVTPEVVAALKAMDNPPRKKRNKKRRR